MISGIVRTSGGSRGSGRRCGPRWIAGAAFAAVSILTLGSASMAGAQQTASPPALGAVLDGDVDGLTATATSAFADPGSGGSELMVTIDISNASAEPRDLAIPFGTLLATDNEGDQTAAVGGETGEESPDATASDGSPILTAAPGDSQVSLVAYCTEHDDTWPLVPTPMHYAGMAGEPLTTVLRNIARLRPSNELAQDAVWWVTDEPKVPVRPELAPLLEGVDTESFAADPDQVIPDSRYAPRWEQSAVEEESFDSGSSDITAAPGGSAGAGIFWLLMAVAAVVAFVLIAARMGRRERPAPAPVRRASWPAGWYRDPWARGGMRWWNGSTWTDTISRSERSEGC